MSTPFTYLAVFTRDVLLPVGTPQDIDLPIDGAGDWTILVRNDGGDPLTAALVSYSPLGGAFSAPEAVADLATLAPGVTVTIVGQHQPLAVLRLTLTTGDPAVTIHIEGGGR